MKNKKNRVWNLVLILAFAVAMLFGMTMTVNADENTLTAEEIKAAGSGGIDLNQDAIYSNGERPGYVLSRNKKNDKIIEYDLWIGGTQVTSENAENTQFGNDGIAKYKADTNTLELDGFQFERVTDGFPSGINSIIKYSPSDEQNEEALKIVLSGNSSIVACGETSQNEPILYGIESTRPLLITGDGNLSVTGRGGTDVAVDGGAGIKTNGTLTVEVDDRRSVTVTGGAGCGSGSGAPGIIGSLKINSGKILVTGGIDGDQHQPKSPTSAVADTIFFADSSSAQESDDNTYWSELVSGSRSSKQYVRGGVMAKVDTPEFDPEEGDFYSPQEVKISCGTEGATIYYTKDGTDPTTDSLLYEKPISISGTTTIKAIAVKKDMVNSETIAATYTQIPYTIIFDPGEGSGTMKSDTIIDGEEYVFPECKFNRPAKKIFNKWEMSGVDGIFDPGKNVKVSSNCAVDGIITVTAKWIAADPATVKTAPKAQKLTYTGTAQQLVTEGVAENGKMNYAIGSDSTTEPTSGWSENVPQKTNADTYYVWYKAVGNETHSDSDAECCTAKIDKATPALTVEPKAITYGQTLADSSLAGSKAVNYVTSTEIEGSFDWTDKTIVPTVADSNNKEYEVTFTPEDKKNFETAVCMTKLTVNKADITPSVSIEGWDYGSAANKPAVSDNPDGTKAGDGDVTFWYKEKDAPDDAYSKTVPTDAGQYRLKAEVAATGNYNAAVTDPVDFTISPIDMKVTSSDYNGVYDGTGRSITVNAPEGAVVTYAKAGGDWTEENPAFAEVGEYEVAFKVNLKNYKEYTGSQKVIIGKAAITIKADDKSSVCGDPLQELTYTVGGAYVKGDDLGVSLTTEADKDKAGTYTISPAWNENPNYDAVLSDGVYTVEEKPEPAFVSMRPKAIKTKGKTALTISWCKVDGAQGYDIFLAKCGKGNAYKMIKTIQGNETFSWTKKQLKPRIPYKAYIKAWVEKDGEKEYIGKTPNFHIYTANGTKKYTNAKKIEVDTTNVALEPDNSYEINANIIKYNQKKKLMPATHTAQLRYMSTNTEVAVVSSSGLIRAKSAGTCRIYVFAANGVNKAIEVTVQ